MKTIKIFFLLIGISVSSLLYAQDGHLKCAPGCVYAQQLQGKNTVSCIDRVCSICHEKLEKERKEKLEADKLAAQKRAQQAEQRKQQQTKLIADQKKQVAIQIQKAKDNEMVLVAPKQKSNNLIIETKKKAKNNIEKFPLWTPVKDETSGLIGFKDKNGKNDHWKIQPQFVEAIMRNTSSFEAGCEYAIVTITKGNRTTGQCGNETFTHEQALIDRKGNIILSSGEGNELEFFYDRDLPFILKLVSTGPAYSCSQEIYSIKEKKVVATISGNFLNSKGNTILFHGIDIYINSLSTSSLNENTINKLKEIYIEKTYDYAKIHYLNSKGWDDPKYNDGIWTAYLMNKSGDFKIVKGEGPIYLK
ncbi:hypothetical protein FLCU109888_07380 [Flavobacterium cucumis]|uniref:Uncharacterized protein n=1 Tax=Flavobacterium cucumis TaxID=416016 RepID=A0A1M7ZWJ9_9FLAO|nr:hypothetical protein [Flavobacterium cucumis]SHO73248.1 hypothetical protein SAMN05443547_1603 [Flavobacterium cucumis]